MRALLDHFVSAVHRALCWHPCWEPKRRVAGFGIPLCEQQCVRCGQWRRDAGVER